MEILFCPCSALEYTVWRPWSIFGVVTWAPCVYIPVCLMPAFHSLEFVAAGEAGTVVLPFGLQEGEVSYRGVAVSLHFFYTYYSLCLLPFCLCLFSVLILEAVCLIAGSFWVFHFSWRLGYLLDLCACSLHVLLFLTVSSAGVHSVTFSFVGE
jgi:hypothetical protein